MSFSGKKYRRIGDENLEKLLNATKSHEQIVKMLKSSAPTFCFTLLEGNKFRLTVQTKDKVLSVNFTLGQEHEIERRNGSKVKVTYTLEGDNILKQDIKMPCGKVAHFRREFRETSAKMTITMDGTDLIASIYYEIVL